MNLRVPVISKVFHDKYKTRTLQTIIIIIEFVILQIASTE